MIDKKTAVFRAVNDDFKHYVIEDSNDKTFILKGFKIITTDPIIAGSKLKKAFIELFSNGSWRCDISYLWSSNLINYINDNIKAWIDSAIKNDYDKYRAFRDKKIATTNAGIKVEAKKRFVNYCVKNNVDFSKEEFEIIIPFLAKSYKKVYKLMPWIIRNKRLRAHLDSDIFQTAQDNVNIKKILE